MNGVKVFTVNVNYDVRLNHDAFTEKADKVLTFLEQVIPRQVKDTLIGKFIEEATWRDFHNANELLVTFRISDHGEEHTVLNVSRGFVAKEPVFEV